MKKRLQTIIAAFSVCLMTAACGGTAAPGKSESQPMGAGFKVGIVVDKSGVDDGSFNQSAWTGAQRAAKQLGVTVNYHEEQEGSDNEANIESFIREDYDLIIGVGYLLAEDLRKEALANPARKFALVDDDSDADLKNVTCLMFEQSEGAYLAGCAAALSSRTGIIGFVQGETTESMNEFGYGYIAGALDAAPGTRILQKDIDSFSDTEAGRLAAEGMIEEGADVVFHAAGGAGLGVIEACRDAGVWAVGVDSDQSVIAPETVLTSAMKRVDVAVYDAIEGAVNGTLNGGIKIYSLRDAGVDIAPTTTNLSANTLDRVNKAKEMIIDGSITVPKTKTEFEAKYGDIYELD